MGQKHLLELQGEYLLALRNGSGREADRVVQKALDDKVQAHSIYLDVFQPVAYEIGRLWQRNEFSVAQEHLATAIIERQMGELHPLFKSTSPKNKTALIGCVADEFHRLGARMVADFLEYDGWSVYYLGAAVPTDSFIGMARELNANLIGVSAQMIFHVTTIAEIAAEADRRGMSGLPIMAGGLPFIQQPDLYKALGVHFSGQDAREAVVVANQF
jgi:MerR family transcriptional regulator, light-induced transcriptional regulator